MYHFNAARLLLTLMVFFHAILADLTKPIMGTYFPNWGIYRPGNYKFFPTKMESVLGSMVNSLWYGFGFFCPPNPEDHSIPQPYWKLNPATNYTCAKKQPFEIIFNDMHDMNLVNNFTTFKKNSDFSFFFSIGSWNFPSQYFSIMVSNKTYRTTFINSAKAFMGQYGFTGIDIDWEYPGSEPRINPVAFNCYDFESVTDLGGSCNDLSQDRANFATFIKEASEAFNGEYDISICGQADPTKAGNAYDFAALAPYVTVWNLMLYDYTVSMTEDSYFTGPNQPLYKVKSQKDLILQDSINDSISFYINNGSIKPENIAVGIALYGHVWHVPGLNSAEEWARYGLNATKNYACCNAWQNTYGGGRGIACIQCGMYMYNEIMAAQLVNVFDNETKTNIAYHNGTSVSPDGYTMPGTWISYQDKESITEIVKLAQSYEVGGVFTFDISMDTIGDNGEFTFELTQLVYDLMQGYTPSWLKRYKKKNEKKKIIKKLK